LFYTTKNGMNKFKYSNYKIMKTLVLRPWLFEFDIKNMFNGLAEEIVEIPKCDSSANTNTNFL
jgi:hypothetical protein